MDEPHDHYLYLDGNDNDDDDHNRKQQLHYIITGGAATRLVVFAAVGSGLVFHRHEYHTF